MDPEFGGLHMAGSPQPRPMTWAGHDMCIYKCPDAKPQADRSPTARRPQGRHKRHGQGHHDCGGDEVRPLQGRAPQAEGGLEEDGPQAMRDRDSQDHARPTDLLRPKRPRVYGVGACQGIDQ